MALYGKGNIPLTVKGNARKDVILSDEGIIRKIQYEDSGGNIRVKKEIIVKSDNYIKNDAGPTITYIDFNPVKNASGVVTGVSVPVSFNQEIVSTGNLTIQVREKTSNTVITATASNTVSRIGNTLNFTFPTSQFGDYEVLPQTIPNNTTVRSKLTNKPVIPTVTSAILKDALIGTGLDNSSTTPIIPVDPVPTPDPLVISGIAPDGIVGVAYTFAPVVTGGSGTKTFSITGGVLPAGLYLNTSTGVISGTPTAATA